ncbi:MAG: FecR domain-containing protein [Lachnospiraceae bacterium]|nr:FecR domain-containing protein [Lachnospiraceae bacterium]
MNVGALLKTTKGKILAGAGGTVVAVGIGVAVLLQGGGYRSIAVEQVAGTVNVVGEMNNGQAYKGEHLYSGDDVTVMDASELVMCMDNDKFVYADANTHFKLEASDKSEDSRIKIYLDAGSELNELQSKLEAGETYEVDTPNSTMSVRGTSFRVTVYKASDGLIYTLTEVTTGEVLVRLKTTDGSYNGVEKLFTPGQSALIRGNSEFSEFVSSGLLDANDIENTGDDDALELAYGSLPEDGMERLIALLEGGNLIASDEEPETKEEVKDIKKEEVKKEEPEKKEELEEDTTEEETDEDDTEEDEDNKTLLQKLAEAAIASRNDDGTINLKDGTLFDPDYYANANPDVVEKFGSSDEDLLAHYLIFGKNEDRAPSEKAEQEKLNEWIAFTKELAASNEVEEEPDEEEDNSATTNTNSNTNNAITASYDSTSGAVTINYKNTTINGTYSTYRTLSILNADADIDLPLVITDTSGNGQDVTLNYLRDIDYEHSSGNITISNSNGTVKKYNGNYTVTDASGTVLYDGPSLADAEAWYRPLN